MANDPLEDFAARGFTEAYDIERRVEVVGPDNYRYRIDVFRDVGRSKSGVPSYCTRAYRSEHVRVQYSYPADANGPKLPPSDEEVWLYEPEVSWTDRDTVDGALDQALGFLAALCKKRAEEEKEG